MSVVEMVISLKLLKTLCMKTYAGICFAFQEWCQNRQYLCACSIFPGKYLLGNNR